MLGLITRDSSGLTQLIIFSSADVYLKLVIKMETRQSAHVDQLFFGFEVRLVEISWMEHI